MAKSMMMTVANAATHTDGRQGQKAPVWAWFEQASERLGASWTWYRNYRESARELDALSDRELDDIGILRCDIPRIASESATAKQTVR